MPHIGMQNEFFVVFFLWGGGGGGGEGMGSEIQAT